MSLLGQLKGHVARFDARVDRYVDGLRSRPGLDRVMYLASELGDHSLVWHLLGTAQALRPGRRPESAVRAAVILGVESALVNGVVKSAFRRGRPVWESEEPRPFRLRTPRTSSFPSGHASSALTAAGILAPGDPLAPVYYAVAGLVGSSRVYVKIHHASDVVAGALLGVALARAANRLWPPIR
ncbi:MAG: phosphatase PAP2 family protein [Acidimicrobiia bacterium]